MRRVVRAFVFALLGISILVGVVLVAALVYLRTESGRTCLREIVIARVRSSVPGFEFARLGGDLTRTIVLERVRVRDREGREAIAAQRIAVRYDLLGLFSRIVRVEEVRVEQPSVVAAPGRSGRLNLSELTVPSEQRPSRPWTFDVRDVVVTDGTARVTTATGQRIEISRLDLAGRTRIDAGSVVIILDRLEIAGLTPAGSIGIRGEAQGPRDDLTLDLRAALPAGGHARLFGKLALGAPSYHLNLALDGVDPHVLRPALQKGDVNLSLSIRGQGLPPEGRAAVDLAVTRSRVEGIAVRAAMLRGSLEGREWHLESLDADAAGIRARAHGHGGARSIALELDAKTAGALPIGNARANLDVHVRVGGVLPDRLELRARGRGRNVVLGDRRIGEFVLSAHATDVPRRPRGELWLAARAIVLGRGQPPLDAIELAAQSDGTHVRMRASGSGSQVRCDLAAHGRLAERAMDFTIDRATLRMPDQTAQLTAPATIHFRRRQSIAIENTRVHLEGRRFRGELAIGGIYRLRTTREPRLWAKLSLRQGSFAGVDHVDLEAKGEIVKNTGRASADVVWGPHRTPIHLEGTFPLSGQRLARKGRIAARMVARNVRLRDLPVVSPAQADVKDGAIDLDLVVDGTIERPDLKLDARLRDLRYRDLSPLQAQASLASQSGHTSLTGSARLRGRPLLDVRGESDVTLAHVLARRPLPDSPLHLVIRVPQVELAELRGLSDRLAGYEGIVRADVEVIGSLGHPRGTVHAAVDRARVDTIAFGPVTLASRFDDQTVVADASLTQIGGGRLGAKARYERASGALDAELHARNIRVDFARALIQRMRDFGGTLDADVTSRGTLSAPTLAGRVHLAQGQIGLVGQPTFRDVELQLGLSPGHVEIQKLHAKSNGTLDAHGSADLRGFELLQLTLSAQANGFAVAVAGTSGRLDGKFGIHAVLRDEVLAGRIEVPEATVWLPRISGGRRLQSTKPHRDLKFTDKVGQAEARKAAQAAERQPVAGRIERIQLQAKAPTVFVRSRDVNLEVDAQTEIKIDEQGQPVITGVVSILNGSININQQRFEIDHARLLFNGEPELNPALDIELRHQYDDTTAIIRLRGTLEKPQLTFTSDPPGLDSSQVVGMIVTGGPLAGAPSTSQFEVAGTIATAILGKLADQIAPQLGLDVIRVSTATTTPISPTPFLGGLSEVAGTSVEVGKYVSARILLSFVHVFGATENSNQNEARVQYSITRRWIMETAFGDAGAGAIDFLWTWRY